MTQLPGISTPAVQQLEALVFQLRGVRSSVVNEVSAAEEALKVARKRLETLDQRVNALCNLIGLSRSDDAAVEIPF